MKLVLKESDTLNERLNITKKEVPCLDSSWHYHAQFELIYISRSSGIRFVGDSVSQFTPGDLVLVGSYLPHLWRNDISYYGEEDTEKKVKTIVIKFTQDFLGKETFDLPEFAPVSELLSMSKFGVCFGKRISHKLQSSIIGITELNPAEQSVRLLDLLCKLSSTPDKTLLSSSDMRQYTSDNSDRLDDVLKFISDNYSGSITLQDVSDVACMTTNSFCRFFKRMTNKSFTQFLNEVRVRNASRLLIQQELPISEICYKVGYSSITNFNKQFKQVLKQTPQQYRKSL
ncbi:MULTISPECIES: AraC family transcriptional regulator [Reichenbachiella]|uniref:AraC family transcriptional regulator n=1 Tax=Reichenbachiella TaxID=156993 RepID=UPI000E6B90F6|nr:MULTISPECIES: AraC family transcriptional regulator [Reichenbachiella]MBU2912751.1 AraC family transcriptional regulator [Reichenbachiella agariperforans]RJE72433.1 hypothetical protein BGP76_00135 [Reichenbachiella sp. MSK19-1]